MCDPTSNRTARLNAGRAGPARVPIGRVLGCLVVSYCLAAGLSSCEALFGSPEETQPPALVAVATAQPTASPTPTISAGDASIAAQKATEAAEKARIASSKAAAASQEAARASAEASQAAIEAELAVKLSQGSSTKKPSRKTAKRSSKSAPATSPASSPSPIATSTNQEKVAASTSTDVSSSPPPTSNLVSAASAAQDQSIQAEAARLIDQTGSSLGKIARNKLNSQDAERYDVASKLLKNARDSFAAQDFIAAHSLANKAAVLIRPLQAATADK